MTEDSNDEEKFYFGLADIIFKERYRNHIRDRDEIRDFNFDMKWLFKVRKLS